jgi:hypothetical protein
VTLYVTKQTRDDAIAQLTVGEWRHAVAVLRQARGGALLAGRLAPLVPPDADDARVLRLPLLTEELAMVRAALALPRPR